MGNSPEIHEQYRAAITIGGRLIRHDRGLIEVNGADRAAWLNNLVTNVIKTVAPGEGNYAFVLNVKGRVLFDVNMLALADRLWLDVDRGWLAKAKEHFDRYIITEDAQIRDLSDALTRTAVVGPRAAAVVEALGLGNLTPMAQLQHVAAELEGAAVRLVRHDFAGLPGAEFLVSGDNRASAVARIERAAEEAGMTPLNPDVVDILRIEAGIPASVADIDEDVVPAETGQIERGINYRKGCYLGQEVVERMRSHNVLARRLVGMQLEGDAVPPRNAPVRAGESEAGRVTSGCWSEAQGGVLTLGYLKTAYAKAGTKVAVEAAGAAVQGEVVELPVRRFEAH